MLDAHTSAGIAQVVFYAPIVPIVIHLFSRNARIRPRMAWWPLIPFSLFRLAGGIVTIIAKKKPDNIGLFIAALILLNVGVVPLIVANLGLTRLILHDNHASNETYDKLAKILRITFIAAILLLAAGGGITSVSPKIGRDLTLAGYIVFAVELLFLTAMQLHFFGTRYSLLPSSRRVLLGVLAACPFLALRTVYGLVEVIEQDRENSLWNPLMGSAVAFSLMALLPEYIVLVGWIFMGYSIEPRREADQTLGDGEVSKV